MSEAPARPLWTRLWPVALLLAGAVLVHASGLTGYLSLDSLRQHHQLLSGWVDGHRALAAIAFVALYITAVTFSMPGAVILTLAGGLYFGAVPGTLLTLLGATTGATLIFLMARRVFGGRAMDRLGAPAARIAEGIRRDAVPYLLTLRLVPVFPFFLVNLVPAFVGVPLPVYVATTALGIIPATAIYSTAGAGLDRILDSEAPVSLGMILTPEILIGLGGLAFLALASIPIRRRLESRQPRP
ncbi:MAG: VTT domain-containing protein [Beijerinckiaceae bacterium]|nr:VTT domain-containing protein [Beijerinckiaceae bacterium]MCZ8301652.1 VTT domain-containing protein [Beijerinckiaceae bacterium]